MNDIITGLRVVTQQPLNIKEYSTSEASLASLGPGNNLAFTYHKGMKVYCVEERSTWEWREPDTEDEEGLLVSNFTYPASLIVDGVDYSNKEYNFFPEVSSSSQNNFVRVLLIEEDNLPVDYTPENICTYVLALPSIERTILDIDSKWNIVIGNTGDEFVVSEIYEIINKGKGVITALTPDDLLLIHSILTLPTLESVIINGNTIDAFHPIIFTGTGGLLFAASVNNAGVISIKGQDTGLNPSMQVGISDADGFPKTSLDFYNDKTLFKDVLSKGIEYAGDYEVNFTDRSLVTKQYVDDKTPYKIAEVQLVVDSGAIQSMTTIQNTFGTTITPSVISSLIHVNISGGLNADVNKNTAQVSVNYDEGNGDARKINVSTNTSGVIIGVYNESNVLITTGVAAPIRISLIIKSLL